MSKTDKQLWRCASSMLNFSCPIQWDSLSITAFKNIKYCEQCNENVYFCETPEVFTEKASLGQCVAIPTELDIPDDSRTQSYSLGRPAPWSLQLEENAMKWWARVRDIAPELHLQLYNASERRSLMKHVIESRISFDKISESISNSPGIYEIWTKSGIGLKVGISLNILKRLKDHAASRASGLKKKPTSDNKNLKPNDFISKKSILAKHLYFDKTIVSRSASQKVYDLTSENGRRDFLRDCCYVIFEQTTSTAEAREKEKEREESGIFRYTGDVVER